MYKNQLKLKMHESRFGYLKRKKGGVNKKKKKKKKKLRKIEGQNVDKINRTIYGKILDGERKREREKKW